MAKRKPADFRLTESMSHPLNRLSWVLGFAQMAPKAVFRLEGDDLTAVQDQIRASCSLSSPNVAGL